MIALTQEDNRMTLYRNPNLQTEKNGTATVKLYNSNTLKKLSKVAEGIAIGLTISTTKTAGKPD